MKVILKDHNAPEGQLPDTNEAIAAIIVYKTGKRTYQSIFIHSDKCEDERELATGFFNVLKTVQALTRTGAFKALYDTWFKYWDPSRMSDEYIVDEGGRK